MSDSEYFERRAKQERASAAQALDPSARRAHLHLAEAYERKAAGKEARAPRFRPGDPAAAAPAPSAAPGG